MILAREGVRCLDRRSTCLTRTAPFSYGNIPWAYNEYDIRGRFVSVQVGIKW